MPLYEFVCRSCGPFESLRTLREASEPMGCPVCHGVARRVLSLPVVRTATRVSQRHGDRSAVPPRVVQRPAPEAPPPSPLPQVQRSGRPWQLQHQRL